MKKVLIFQAIIFLTFLIVAGTMFATESIFFSSSGNNGDKQDTAAISQPEEKTPEVKTETETETGTGSEAVLEPLAETAEGGQASSAPLDVITDNEDRVVYNMLDFDRRLILKVGEQDQYLCSIFNLAYARAILDGSFSVDPYRYYDGEGAVWSAADYADIAYDDDLLTVLQRAYDEISEGRPVIFYVEGIYGYTTGKVPVARKADEHFVLLIGYRSDCDYDDLKPSDFYAADPSSGYKNDKDAHMPWIVLTDEAPRQYNGEYALYAPVTIERRVGTCLAYPDTVMWDAPADEPIMPELADSGN